MEKNVRAYEKYLRISPSKILRYSREIKLGTPVNNALAKLNYVPAKGAGFLKKAIASAKANYINIATKNNIEYDEDNIVIEKILVHKAPSFKRLRPKAKGRADMYLRRNAHILVEVNERKLEE